MMMSIVSCFRHDDADVLFRRPVTFYEDKAFVRCMHALMRGTSNDIVGVMLIFLQVGAEDCWDVLHRGAAAGV